jgi:hypothetical protein
LVQDFREAHSTRKRGIGEKDSFGMSRRRILAALLVLLVVAGVDQAWSYASPPFVGAGRQHKFDRVHRKNP